MARVLNTVSPLKGSMPTGAKRVMRASCCRGVSMILHMPWYTRKDARGQNRRTGESVS